MLGLSSTLVLAPSSRVPFLGRIFLPRPRSFSCSVVPPDPSGVHSPDFFFFFFFFFFSFIEGRRYLPIPGSLPITLRRRCPPWSSPLRSQVTVGYCFPLVCPLFPHTFITSTAGRPASCFDVAFFLSFVLLMAGTAKFRSPRSLPPRIHLWKAFPR